MTSNEDSLTVETRYRACVSTYLVFGAITGIPFLISLLATLKNPTVWPSVIACFFIMAAVFWWLNTFKIQLSESGVSYRSFFKGAVYLAFSEIKEAKTDVTFSEVFGPPIRLVLTPKPNVAKPPIIVNIKVFCRRDVAQLLKILESRITQQRIHLTVPRVFKRKTR
jgi:hypothetical protein